MFAKCGVAAGMMPIKPKCRRHSNAGQNSRQHILRVALHEDDFGPAFAAVSTVLKILRRKFDRENRRKTCIQRGLNSVAVETAGLHEELIGITCKYGI